MRRSAAAIGATSTGWAASPADEGLSAELDEVTVTGSRIRRNGFDAVLKSIARIQELNRAGAGGQVGFEALFNAAPDGHTLGALTGAVLAKVFGPRFHYL